MPLRQERTWSWIGILVGLVCWGVAARGACADEKVRGKVLFLAAASTSDAVEELRRAFIAENPQATIDVSFAASSTLAQQIERGAPADLFLSASPQWSDYVKDKQLSAKVVDLLGNELVVIVPVDSALAIHSLADLASASIKHLALGDPKAVPAGQYAQQALQKAGIWNQVELRVAGAADVRQALQFVETGAAEAGIVYATDAKASSKVKVALAIDATESEPIRYPLVLLKRGAENRAASALFDYLQSPTAAAVFRRHGFVVLGATAGQK